MEFGVISLSDIQHDRAMGERTSAAWRVEDAIFYAELSDRTGLDVFVLGEHYTPDYAVASPAVVLGAIAARTERLRLASGVTVLSVADPVRVYQDFAQLDLVSGGRAEIVAGRSAFSEPFALFGVPIEEYDAVFEEKVRLLLQLAREDRVTWSGRWRPSLRDAPIMPRALQAPLPVWAGVGGSPDSAIRAGRLGLPIVLGFIGGTFAHARHILDLYRAAGAAAGHTEKPRIAISTHFYAAATPDGALAVHPYYAQYLRPKTPGGRGWIVEPTAFAAGTQRGNALMIGSVDQLVEKIVDAHELLGVDRFIGQVDWGGLPRELVEASIVRLATEIALQVRAALGHADG